MTGILLLGVSVAIGYVAYWAIINDGVEDPVQQRGWLQMKVTPKMTKDAD